MTKDTQYTIVCPDNIPHYSNNAGILLPCESLADLMVCSRKIGWSQFHDLARNNSNSLRKMRVVEVRVSFLETGE